MEPSETVLSSYYQHHSQQQPPPPPPPPPQQQPALNSAASPPPLNGTVSAKKRGRPRKYNTPEEAAAARRAQLAQPKKPRPAAAVAAVVSPISAAPAAGGISFSPPPPPPPSAAKAACGNVGQGFTPHIISVAAGEDVYQKIMLFMQQSKREICILSASGSISSPFLRQPATSGGNVTYEGRFDILSLSGSYIRTDLGGRTGGLSVCLSSADGQIIGGGVGGPLRAAGPVEVIVGTFLIDTKKDLVSASKGMEQMV